MEVNAPIVYDTTSAREFINNLSSKNKKIEAVIYHIINKHIQMKLKNYLL